MESKPPEPTAHTETPPTPERSKFTGLNFVLEESCIKLMQEVEGLKTSVAMNSEFTPDFAKGMDPHEVMRKHLVDTHGRYVKHLEKTNMLLGKIELVQEYARVIETMNGASIAEVMPNGFEREIATVNAIREDLLHKLEVIIDSPAAEKIMEEANKELQTLHTKEPSPEERAA